MNYEMLYKLIKQNPELKLSDLPNMLEDNINAVKSEDLIGGMLGMYLNKKLPKALNIAPDSISYNPSKDSSYKLSLGNTPTISASWRF